MTREEGGDVISKRDAGVGDGVRSSSSRATKQAVKTHNTKLSKWSTGRRRKSKVTFCVAAAKREQDKARTLWASFLLRASEFVGDKIGYS